MLDETQKDLAQGAAKLGYMPNAAEINVIGALANKIEKNGAAAAQKAQKSRWEASNFMTAQRILQASRGNGQRPGIPPAPQMAPQMPRPQAAPQMPPVQPPRGFGRTQ